RPVRLAALASVESSGILARAVPTGSRSSEAGTPAQAEPDRGAAAGADGAAVAVAVTAPEAATPVWGCSVPVPPQAVASHAAAAAGRASSRVFMASGSLAGSLLAGVAGMVTGVRPAAAVAARHGGRSATGHISYLRMRLRMDGAAGAPVAGRAGPARARSPWAGRRAAPVPGAASPPIGAVPYGVPHGRRRTAPPTGKRPRRRRWVSGGTGCPCGRPCRRTKAFPSQSGSGGPSTAEG